MSVFSLALFFLVGCAKPLYERAIVNNDQVIGQQVESCALMFKEAQVCLAWRFETRPTETKEGILVAYTFRPNHYDRSRILLDAGELSVEFFMPSMGHDSSPVTLERRDVGTFVATDAFLIMSGAWEARFTLKRLGQKSEVVISAFTFYF